MHLNVKELLYVFILYDNLHHHMICSLFPMLDTCLLSP
jgi:hypothetical protein